MEDYPEEDALGVNLPPRWRFRLGRSLQGQRDESHDRRTSTRIRFSAEGLRHDGFRADGHSVDAVFEQRRRGQRGLTGFSGNVTSK